ncbi:MAG: VOC family protein [Pseudomonadota bacterium]
MALEPWMNCRDMPTSFKFYTEVLGFEAIVAPDPDPTQFDSRHATLRAFGGILHLDSHSRVGPFGGKLYVRTENIDELFDKFVANGLSIEHQAPDPHLRGGPIDQTWGMREFWLTDPDGNIITFGESLRSIT